MPDIQTGSPFLDMLGLPEIFAAAQVHRFRGAVALWTRNKAKQGATVYMAPDTARAIAAALIAGADDVDRRRFTESQFRTVEIQPDTLPPPDMRRMYRIVRFYEGDRPNRHGRTLMTLAEAQAHCRNPNTKGPGFFDGFEMHPRFKGAE